MLARHRTALLSFLLALAEMRSANRDQATGSGMGEAVV